MKVNKMTCLVLILAVSIVKIQSDYQDKAEKDRQTIIEQEKMLKLQGEILSAFSRGY